MKYSNLRFVPFLITIILFVNSVKAQYTVTEHLMINNGNSNNNITDLVLDNKGRLWIATGSGLACYDGAGYQNYNISNACFSSNMLNTLWYDETSNSIFVGTKGKGIVRINTETGAMQNINAPDGSIENVMKITQAHDGKLWIICHSDIFKFDINTENIDKVGLCNKGQFLSNGVDDGNGNLILGCYRNEAYVLNNNTTTLSVLHTQKDKSFGENVNDILKDHTGRIWLAMNSGLWFYQPGSDQLIPFDLSVKATRLQEINNSEIWASNSLGIQIIDLNNKQHNFLDSEGDINLPSGLTKIYQDRYGNIWLGTSGMGVYFISHRKSPFQRIYPDPIWGIYQDKDLTWVGSMDKVLAFHGPELVKELDLSKWGVHNCKITTLIGNDSNKLYAGELTGLFSIDKESGKIQYIKQKNGSDVSAFTFFKDTDDIWVTTADGVYSLHDDVLTEEKEINEAINHQSSNGIRRDKQGKFWIATVENGIYLFGPDKKLLSHLSQQNGFFSNSIEHLKMDSQMRLWLSTPDGAGCIPDTEKPNEFKFYSYKDGLADTHLRAMQEDRKGHIWMSVSSGIAMLDLPSGKITNYNVSEQIPVSNFSGGAALQYNGGIVFTSAGGLLHFYPEDLTNNRPLPEINILSVTALISNEDGNQDLRISPDRYGIWNLPNNQNSIRIALGCPDYAEKHLIEYEYYIKPGGNKWVIFDGSRITFRNLSPNTYDIKFRWKLKGHEWQDINSKSITINIDPVWYLSIWAKIIYLCILGILLWLVFNHYWQKMKLQNELELEKRKNIDEHQRNTERLHFFTNITHELKTPLTLIQAPLEEILQEKNIDEDVRKRIQIVELSSQRLVNLCNKLIEFRKTETNTTMLTVNSGKVSELINEIGQSYKELNTNAKLIIEVSVPDNEQPILFDKESLRSILTNLMSNALKYTPVGFVRLTEKQYTKGDESFTEISVADTGYGIAKDALPHIFERYYQAKGAHQASGTGIGLAIVKSLANLHEAKLEVESKENEGSTFTLTLRNKNAYVHALHKEVPEPIPDTEIEADVAEETDTRPLILVVEDDAEILNYIAMSLGKDYRIAKASNGKVGLEQAINLIPDIIITDIMMPVINGTELCKNVKNDVRTSHIPIIMLTAKDTMDDKQEGYESGADSYLTKPFSIQMLKTRIQNLLKAKNNLIVWINASRLRSLESRQDNNRQDLNSPTDEKENPTISVYDQNFLKNLHEYIVAHISEPNILMDDIGQELKMSHSTLYRKIKALTGLSGPEFIRKERIIYSAEILQSGKYNVSEAAYQCGFSSLPYFRSSFKEVFGVLPSEYRKQ